MTRRWKFVSWSALVGLLFCGLVTGQSEAEGSKDKDIGAIKKLSKDAVDEILQALKSRTVSKEEKRTQVFATLKRTTDLGLVAKLVLGRAHWSKADEASRKQYTELFSEILLESMFEKLVLFTDESVELSDPKPTGSRDTARYRVSASIVSKGEKSEIALFFARRNQQWKAYDIEIEGVSVRQSYASQYRDFLAEKSFDALLEAMEEQLSSMRSKVKEDSEPAGATTRPTPGG